MSTSTVQMDESVQFDNYKSAKSPEKNNFVMQSVNKIETSSKNLASHQLDMERLYMTREDKLSLEAEEYNYKLKFIQKDM